MWRGTQPGSNTGQHQTKQATRSPWISQKNCFILDLIVHGQLSLFYLVPISILWLCYWPARLLQITIFGIHLHFEEPSVCFLSASVSHLLSVCPQCERCRCGEWHPSVHPRHRHVYGRLGHLAAVSQSGPEEAAWGHGTVQWRLPIRGTGRFHLSWNEVRLSGWFETFF